MESFYIVTFIGDDRPGLVEELSAVIEKNGGNWLESSLSQLGGKFAGLIHVSLPAASFAALEADLQTLAESGLSVRLASTEHTSSTTAGKKISLAVIGPDRPGIVREVSRALAQRDINVVEMESRIETAPMSAEKIFSARIIASIPANSDLDDLSDNLEEIANQMTLEIEID